MYRKAPGIPSIAGNPADPIEKLTVPSVNNRTTANDIRPAAEFKTANRFGFFVRIYTEIIANANKTRKIIPNILLPLSRLVPTLCTTQQSRIPQPLGALLIDESLYFNLVSRHVVKLLKLF